MSEKERMLAGRLYSANDPELQAARQRARNLVFQFNQLAPDQRDLQSGLLQELFDVPSGDAYVEAPLRVDYGKNTHLGHNFYANYDCIILDIAPVTIGDNVLFGPRVSVLTAGHPIDKDVRNAELEFGKPITIGNNVWAGGSVTICPGVTIGANVIIGAGAVVTRDVPANMVVAGVPACPLRQINDNDRRDWQQAQAEYLKEKAND
ncbi:sugar O-acetyltransferase [Lacticaseibacillus manihotivorans]|uniref:Acetyltransferase n=2 Tax=Lacticaseibacillus manihotivorans TaxID=88233 RepID=A0A0R1QSV3_9LACO|nr:sugar O-acetyltransferase [Lacticaseibacillus manihotivorans]KRL47294.1 maltose O-acetyltransferase [Lacticaseibacillus manihotivorans DSM 13343 = JCM 12514]QFQ90543.1 sugar O-acetyltransferase [Lacticaseibacillus manihotivorans]